MSIERRGGDDYSPTVQRRGEKNTIFPGFKKPEAVLREKVDPSESKPPGIDPLLPQMSAIAAEECVQPPEARIQKRVAELEADPAAKKEFLDKVGKWTGKIIFLFILMFAFPPILGIVIPLGVFLAFSLSLTPKGRQSKIQAKIHQVIEMFVVASKLKKSTSKS